jgi:hypothetical protein
MAGRLGGECARLDTVVYTSCDMLVACDLAHDLERAARWCQVADQFIQTYGCPFLYARCRTIYGGLLVATGRWPEGERDSRPPSDSATGAGPAVAADAFARLADLRLRQGRLEEASTLLRDSRTGPTSPRPRYGSRGATPKEPSPWYGGSWRSRPRVTSAGRRRWHAGAGRAWRRPMSRPPATRDPPGRAGPRARLAYSDALAAAAQARVSHALGQAEASGEQPRDGVCNLFTTLGHAARGGPGPGSTWPGCSGSAGRRRPVAVEPRRR